MYITFIDNKESLNKLAQINKHSQYLNDNIMHNVMELLCMVYLIFFQ